MTLQAKLTLGTVLMETVIVAVISAVYLGNMMDLRFESAQRNAKRVNYIVLQSVKNALNNNPQQSVKEALVTAKLHDQLETELSFNPEVSVVTIFGDNHELLADVGSVSSDEHEVNYPALDDLLNTSWLKKFDMLSARNLPQYYQVSGELGPVPKITVRVLVATSLVTKPMIPDMQKMARLAIICLVGAIGLTFLFSALAFLPLGSLRRQLDLLAAGDYEKTSGVSSAPANDEVSLIASKVSLLGEKLRGAQFEVSDLRGNIDRLLQELEDAVLIFNRENRLVFASGSVSRFLGRERGALSGESIGDIFPPSSNLGLLISQAAETRMIIRNRRIPVESPSGAVEEESFVLLSVDLLQDQYGGRTGILVRLRDPEAQRQIGQQLQTADRLAAISRISGGVAHEVKNPLNAILLHVEVAKTRLKKGEADVTPQMEVISREILRLDRVVKTFLDFTRPVELKYQVVFLRDVLAEIVDLARPQAEAEKINLGAAEVPEDIEVRIDRDLFKQAVLNVVVNGMQSMKEGGELRLECVRELDSVEIRIADTGSGIPPELRDKIFRLYFTTKEGGSGIGLAMTFRIIQLHDGTIDFSSEPGKGTTFFIRLPIAV